MALRAMLIDGGEHFSHYDLLCGRRAPELVFPEVAKFLGRVELFGGRLELWLGLAVVVRSFSDTERLEARRERNTPSSTLSRQMASSR